MLQELTTKEDVPGEGRPEPEQVWLMIAIAASVSVATIAVVAPPLAHQARDIFVGLVVGVWCVYFVNRAERRTARRVDASEARILARIDALRADVERYRTDTDARRKEEAAAAYVAGAGGSRDGTVIPIRSAN